MQLLGAALLSDATIRCHELADSPMVVAVAGWIQRDQQAAIDYLREENRVLKARLSQAHS